jgi:uncharacterized membrane protein YcaP (DUF421 family)
MFKEIDWQGIFIPETPLLEIFIRGSLVYLGLFLLLRVLLKRESGTLGITDMLLVVLIADAAQNGMAHDYRSVPEGLFLVATIIFWSWVLNWLGHHFPFFQKLVKPRKLLLVKDGRMIKENMQKELITTSELMSEVRMSGVEELSQVKAAYMEPSGNISVITYEQSPGKHSEKQIV